MIDLKMEREIRLERLANKNKLAKKRLQEELKNDPHLAAIVHAVETAASSECDYARSIRLARAALKKIRTK